MESEVDVGVGSLWRAKVSQDEAKTTTSPGASGLAHWHSPSLFILFFEIFIYLVAPGVSSVCRIIDLCCNM